MSESEEEGEAPALPVEQEGPIYPLEGKFLSEKDKAEIMAMPELQRETVLADRAAEMQRRREDLALRQLRENRLKVEAQADAIKKRKAPEIDDTPRKANRTKMTKTNEKLENYKKAREQRTEQRKRNEDRKTGDRDSPAKNDAEESDKDADGEEDVEWDEPASRAPAKNEAQPEMRDYERIRVGRTNFARVCFWPGFEDAIKGCFTRVCIGLDKATNQNTYRMCQIKGRMLLGLRLILLLTICRIHNWPAILFGLTWLKSCAYGSICHSHTRQARKGMAFLRLLRQ